MPPGSSLISAASWVRKADASKSVIGPMPHRPATRPSHVDARSFPREVTAPSPVTTTRRSVHRPDLTESDRTWAARIPLAPRAAVYDPRAMAPRVDWHRYFMNIAHEVASRATCPRKHVGAVIVRDKRILSTGYNGSLRGLPHCDEVGLPHGGRPLRRDRPRRGERDPPGRDERRPHRGRRDLHDGLALLELLQARRELGPRRAIYFGEFYREKRIHDYAERVGIQLVDLSALAVPGA